jgi:transposase-like protein
MSTKREDRCPRCGTANMPTDEPIFLDHKFGRYYIKFWRYECSDCEYIFANDLQRTHNEREYYRKLKIVNNPGGWDQ